MDTLTISVRGATRHELARRLRELATALSHELADTDAGRILNDDGITAGRWSLEAQA